jgi:hypothetical protein
MKVAKEPVKIKIKKGVPIQSRFKLMEEGRNLATKGGLEGDLWQ